MVIPAKAAAIFTSAWNHSLICGFEVASAGASDRNGAECSARNSTRNSTRTCAMYRTVTHNIEVVVTPRFVADRSSPENNYFFWAYPISITNNGDQTVQLKTRHWRITDAHG